MMGTTQAALCSALAILAVCHLMGMATMRIIGGSLVAPERFLQLPLGTTLFLVSFSLVAKVTPSYGYTLVGLLFVAVLLVALSPQPRKQSRAPISFDLACYGVFLLAFGLTLHLHSHWPALHWENTPARAGVEKLFNLSLNQSFLFGHGFPPESLWLAGESTSYYILPRILPGLSGWLARVLFSEPGTAGIQFLLWEAIFVGLSASSVTAWSIALLKLRVPDASARPTIAISISAGLLALTTVHFKGLTLGLESLLDGLPLNWWILQEQVVRYTQNQYPIWLILLGDSHSYSQVIPFQLTLLGLFGFLASEDRINVHLSVLTGISAACVALSHLPSVLLSGVTIAPALLVLLIWESRSPERFRFRALIVNAAICAATAIFAVLPSFSAGGPTKKVFPSSDVVSRIPEFLDVQFPILVWIGLLLTVMASSGKISSALVNIREGSTGLSRAGICWLVALALLGGIAMWMFGRPAISLSIALACALFLLTLAASPLSVSTRVSASILLCAFGIWILPETLAIDSVADNRTLWIRFNIVLRFWPEGYYLIPLATTFAFGPPLLAALTDVVQRRIFVSLAGSLATLFLVSQLPAIQDRDRRATEQHGIDGFEFLGEIAPIDAQIVSLLARLPASSQVVLAEACGTGRYPNIPSSFGWPGRFSAFSGRPAVCGWARHSLLHQPKLAEGTASTWSRLERYEAAWLRLALEAGATLTAWRDEDREAFRRELPLDRALKFVTDLGATHFVYGESEAKHLGPIDVERLAIASNGYIELRAGTGRGIVRLAAP